MFNDAVALASPLGSIVLVFYDRAHPFGKIIGSGCIPFA
jgi:hypothetical protein